MTDRVTEATGTITRLLRDARHGRESARDEVVALVYDDLRALARKNLRLADNSASHATTVVHSACERLLRRGRLDAENRVELFFLLNRAMRDVIVERIREEQAQKRGGGWSRVDDRALVDQKNPTQSISMDLANAIDELTRIDPIGSYIVTLRFFGGRSLREASSLAGCTFAEGRGHWEYARAWLHDRLDGTRTVPQSSSGER